MIGVKPDILLGLLQTFSQLLVITNLLVLFICPGFEVLVKPVYSNSVQVYRNYIQDQHEIVVID